MEMRLGSLRNRQKELVPSNPSCPTCMEASWVMTWRKTLFQFTGETKLTRVSDPIEKKIKMIHIDFDSLEEIVPFTKVILFYIWKLILGGKDQECWTRK